MPRPSHDRAFCAKLPLLMIETSVRAKVFEAARIDGLENERCRDKIRAKVQEQYLNDIAEIDEVRLIEPVEDIQLFNDRARGIVEANINPTGVAFIGTDQTIAVADGALDKDHPAFLGRIESTYTLGSSLVDKDGHGTHVSGSVLGSLQYEARDSAGTVVQSKLVQGIAPGARLVFQSMVDNQGGLGGCPQDLRRLFKIPYRNDGARVHNNSWGPKIAGKRYTKNSEEIDDFVWKNPDMVICFAACNGRVVQLKGRGVDMRKVGAFASAKNCITVGASECGRVTSEDGLVADGPFDSLAEFSNRGPTQEGRYKPDLVAPGTSILSASAGHAKVDIRYGRSLDHKFKYLSGTSMACPIVAGCAAIVREFLLTNLPPSTKTMEFYPSAALVKALLINGAIELPAAPPSTSLRPAATPNSDSGWGRVNLAISTQPCSKTFGYDEVYKFEDDQVLECTVDVQEAHRTLKVTLVWSDHPGHVLINDLDLCIIAADRSERHGNMGTSQNFDRCNNVEQVRWVDIPKGKATIRIIGHRVETENQPFAYAWRISPNSADLKSKRTGILGWLRSNFIAKVQG